MQQDKLRPYQAEAVKQIFTAWKQGYRKPLLQIPCGGGKTTVAAYIVSRFVKEGRKILFVTHREELTAQAHSRFAIAGIDSGLVIPGRSPNTHLSIVGNIQSLIRREPLRDISLIIIDECHHVLSPTFLKMLAEYSGEGTRILGLTATVFRLDNKPLGRVFDHLVSPVTIDELIAQKYLVPLRYYAAAEKGLTLGVRKIAGDYAANTIFAKMNKKFLYDGVIEKYKKFSGGKALVFCCNVQHSQITAKAFSEAGIRAKHVDGETPTQERIKIVKDFRQGKIDVLTNCNLFCEGFNLTDISSVILNRATASKCLYTQMVGRAMRISPGKEYGVVIDMGNSVTAHGFVEDLQEHDIFKEPRKGDGVAPMKDCPKCGTMMYASATTCKYCGFVFPVVEMELKEAEFVEVKRQPVPLHLRKPWRTMTEKELEEFAAFKGYKKGWIYHQMRLRDEGKGIGRDDAVYTFFHSEHGLRNCTKAELEKEFSFSKDALSAVVRGSVKSARGWIMASNMNDENFTYGTLVGKHHPKYDPTIYKFYHKDHGIVESTKYDLVNKFSINRKIFSDLISGQRKSRNGWSIITAETQNMV